MNLNNSTLRFTSPAHQKGMVLLVGLVMVLLLTIIGLAAIRGSGLQEQMAFNMRDRTVALLAAESGLRVAETAAAGYGNPPSAPCAVGGGICSNLNGTAQSPSNGLTAWQNLSAPIVGLNVVSVATQPRQLVEIINTVSNACAASMSSSYEVMKKLGGCNSTRVTVVSSGAEPTTQVVLQSTMNQ